MEELTLTTPSILFSAISLLMLAYTNRFLAYAQVIRNLTAQHDQSPTVVTRKQIENLRRRLYMSRSMQVFGVASLFLCVVCTLLIYVGFQTAAVWTFGVALLLLIISLGISIQEMRISVRALEYHLDRAEKGQKKQSPPCIAGKGIDKQNKNLRSNYAAAKRTSSCAVRIRKNIVSG